MDNRNSFQILIALGLVATMMPQPPTLQYKFKNLPRSMPIDKDNNLSNHWNYARQAEDYEDTKRGKIRIERKQGRNILCKCGSGKKYKHCCGRRNNV